MKCKKRLQGFTLIEMVMVIVIISIISVMIGRVLLQSYQSFNTSENINSTDWQGLLALNRFINDVHIIRSANDITTISATSFAFVDVSGNTVTYALSGTNLQRSGLKLAGNVSSIGFAYYDGNFATTAIPTSVRYITLTTTLTLNNLSQTFSTMAATRGMP